MSDYLENQIKDSLRKEVEEYLNIHSIEWEEMPLEKKVEVNRTAILALIRYLGE